MNRPLSKIRLVRYILKGFFNVGIAREALSVGDGPEALAMNTISAFSTDARERQRQSEFVFSAIHVALRSNKCTRATGGRCHRGVSDGEVEKGTRQREREKVVKVASMLEQTQKQRNL